MLTPFGTEVEGPTPFCSCPDGACPEHGARAEAERLALLAEAAVPLAATQGERDRLLRLAASYWAQA